MREKQRYTINKYTLVRAVFPHKKETSQYYILSGWTPRYEVLICIQWFIILKGKGSETYVFPCDRWLARDEEDGAIERELVANKVLEEIVKKDGTVKKRDRKLDSTLEGILWIYFLFWLPHMSLNIMFAI